MISLQAEPPRLSEYNHVVATGLKSNPRGPSHLAGRRLRTQRALPRVGSNLGVENFHMAKYNQPGQGLARHVLRYSILYLLHVGMLSRLSQAWVPRWCARMCPWGDSSRSAGNTSFSRSHAEQLLSTGIHGRGPSTTGIHGV